MAGARRLLSRERAYLCAQGGLRAGRRGRRRQSSLSCAPSLCHLGNTRRPSWDAGFLLVFVCAAAGSGEAEAAPNRERADGRAARLYVLDAAGEMRAVAALELPGAVPYGLHSAWLPVEDLA